jgi:predicted transcriptional regulator
LEKVDRDSAEVNDSGLISFASNLDVREEIRLLPFHQLFVALELRENDKASSGESQCRK